MAIRNSTDHVIQGPSKEREHTKVEFCGIVIPKETAKNIPYYDLQPTWELAFQHRRIKEQVQHEHQKKPQKKVSL